MLAGAQPGLGEDRVMGGREDLGSAARLLPGKALGNRDQHPLMDDGELGLATAAHDAHHAVALGEPLRPGTQSGDLAGQLQPGNVLR